MSKQTQKTAVAQAKPAKAETPRIQLVIGPDLVEKVDEWRGKQPGVPNRSKAIRMLLAQSLCPKN